MGNEYTFEEKIQKLEHLGKLLNSNAISLEEYNLLKTNILANNSKKKHFTMLVIFIFFISVIGFLGYFYRNEVLKLWNKNEVSQPSMQESNEEKKQSLINTENKKSKSELNAEKIKPLNDIKFNLLDEGSTKMYIYLGNPDFEGRLCACAKSYAIYFDRVVDNGEVKHLVIFYYYKRIVEVHAVDEGKRCYGGIHYIKVSRNGLASNGDGFNTTSGAGSGF